MRRSFTIIESVLSTLIVGVMMVAAVRVVAASRVIQFKNAARVQGALLAEALLNEIVRKPYEDAASPVFGREAGETGTVRDSLDDVDDYNGWSEKPPVESSGSPIPGLGDWGLQVVVERVLPLSVTGPAAAVETGAKRITVKATFNGVPIFTSIAVRTSAR